MGELGKIAPSIQKTYSNAADSQSALAQGYSDALRAKLGGEAANAGDFLSNVAGGGQVADTSGAADVTYGLGGALPSSALNKSGAAFTAQAKMLPGIAGLQGRQDATRAGLESIQARRELEKQVPALRTEALNNLLQQELNKYGARINAGYLRNAQAQTQLDAFTAAANVRHQRHQDKQDAQDAEQEAQDAKGDKNKARQAFWDKTQNNALGRALDLADGKPNPNFDPAAPPGSPASQETVPYQYAQAFKMLWNAYGSQLRRRGFKSGVIEKMLRQVLIAAGFRPPAKAGEVFPQIPPGGFPEGT